MVGVQTLLQALKEQANTKQVTITTEQLSGNQTHDFDIDENDSNVSSVDFKPSDETLPNEALIMMVRPIVVSGSTDSDFFIFEDDDREGVDEALRITGLSVNDNVQTFQPGSAQGAPFQNQDDANQFHLRVDENSNTQSQYTFRIRWLDLEGK